MSYLDKLPNEIIRSIYSYIHPAFEYEKYQRALIIHGEERLCFANMIHNATNVIDIESRIHCNDLVSSYSLLMNDCLHIIKDFIAKNKKMWRPYSRNNLQPWQFRTAWQYYYSKNRVTYIEKQINLNNIFDSYGRCNNLLHLLYHGTLDELLHSCIKNNLCIKISDYNNDIESKRKLAKRLMSI